MTPCYDLCSSKSSLPVRMCTAIRNRALYSLINCYKYCLLRVWRSGVILSQMRKYRRHDPWEILAIAILYVLFFLGLIALLGGVK